MIYLLPSDWDWIAKALTNKAANSIDPYHQEALTRFLRSRDVCEPALNSLNKQYLYRAKRRKKKKVVLSGDITVNKKPTWAKK